MVHLTNPNETSFPRHDSTLLTPSLDLLSLLTFEQPLALCQKCRAISKSLRQNKQGQIFCRNCQVEYVVHGNCKIEQLHAYFKNKGCYIGLDNPIEQCKQLASIAQNLRQYSPDYPPLRGLHAAFDKAQKFIHFVTFGTDQQMLSTLKQVSQRVQVCGIVSLPPEQTWLLSELEYCQKEAPNLLIKTITPSSINWQEAPHQKLVVIDGLLAFKGSVNLKQVSWRKAAHFYEELEVVTNIEQVVNLHNRYFSTVWADLSELGDQIAIDLND